MIVRSALPETTKAGTFPCNSNRCETCKYILCKIQVAIPNTEKVYTILDHYSCSTGGIYIGETGQKLRTRMNHHRHKINTKSCDTPGTLKLNGERKIYEFKCMELFNTLRQGLNLGSGFMSHYGAHLLRIRSKKNFECRTGYFDHRPSTTTLNLI
ncbi:hypothetical protein XELAEV_18003779mg [Xenopus laevis]|nr:hypothetical protein XELAEV_18003779mg [Xenopus laevis]